MGTLVNKSVEMTADDWRAQAAKARDTAIQCIHGNNPSYSFDLLKVANYLRAARVFDGHANMLELDGSTDVAEVEAWDLSDEE